MNDLEEVKLDNL